MKKILLILLLCLGFINVYADSYVTDILVDGVSLQGFSSDKYEYSLEVDSKKDKITVVFVYDKDKYKVSGTPSNISLNPGLNKATLTVKDNDLKTLATYVVNITREDSRSNENSLLGLMIGGKKVELTDKLEYDVLVNNDLKKVELKATLKDLNSKFVSGYGERTGNNSITLSGEKTSVEVKVEAENGEVKTYKINIIKDNYKSNDNSLKSLKIDKIPFNFKSNIYEYNLNTIYDVDVIKLEAVANDSKATITYDKEINLKVGTNNIIIKVEAEDKSVKEYKLNITRSELIPLVKDITITGIDFTFDSNIKTYNIKTNNDKLSFKVTLNDENSKVNEIGNDNITNNSKVILEVSNDSRVETYTFIIEKEELDIDDKTDDKIDDDNKINEDVSTNVINSFLKKHEMIIALSTFGLGILLLLVAVVIKTSKVK